VRRYAGSTITATVGDIEPLVDAYEQFAVDGLVLFESDRITVTALGRFFLRNLAFPLDAYRGAADGTRCFSRAV
jgi:oxygen-independent coproporphyrinogen-3 oxidase